MKKSMKLIIMMISVMMVIAGMSVTSFAYTAIDDDGDRANANDESYNIVYGTTGMLRIMDEGTSVKVNDDSTVTVTAKTASSKTWGSMTKLAFIEQTATDAEKEAAAKDIVYNDDKFYDTEVSRILTFTIPMSDVGKKIPVSRYVSTSTTEGSWKDFSTQHYLLVEKSAIPTELALTNNVPMFKPEALSVSGKEGAYVLHLTMGSTSYDSVFVGYASDAKEEASIKLEPVEDKAYADIPVQSLAEPIVLAFHGSKYFNRTLTVDLEKKTAVFDPTEISFDRIDAMTTEEAIASAERDATVDWVNALIEAIQVQSRNDKTDKYCAVAKAYYDALSAKDKDKLDDPGYFGDDTGDASKDDPLNQDNIGAKELLVVSFGTSFNNSRANDIGGIEKALAAAYPDWSVRRAFTAQIIINHIQARDGVKIDNMEQALQRAIDNKVKELIIQPTHLMHGAEYDELVKALDAVKGKFQIVKVAEPLLGPVGESETVINDDKAQAAKALVDETLKVAGFESIEKAEEAKTAFVFMGHGTAHDAAITYSQMQTQMKELGYKNCFVGTVEGNPASTALPEVKKAVEAAGYTKVILRPMMVVAGDHANNDMAADEEGSWYYAFVNGGEFEVEGADQPVDIGEGFGTDNVTCQIEGLGRIAAIQQMYVDHTKVSVDEVKADETQAAIAKVKAGKIKSFKAKAGKKKVTFTWKKNTVFAGYQLKYKAGKKTKTLTIKSAKTVKKIVKKLKKGTKVTAQIRGYKKIAGKTYYGKWAKAKAVKVK